MYKEEKLKYGYASLEPYIDTHTIGLHHERHYLSYLKKLNILLEKNKFSFSIPKEELVYHMDEFPKEDREDILFNLGGVINHEIYFSILSGDKKNKPTLKLQKMIETYFTSYENFKELFKKEALSIKGSGYTYLVLDQEGKLKIISLKNQELPFSYNLYPVIVLDMWEHAYYLNNQNRKEDYIDSFFTILNFEEIEKRI